MTKKKTKLSDAKLMTNHKGTRPKRSLCKFPGCYQRTKLYTASGWWCSQRHSPEGRALRQDRARALREQAAMQLYFRRKRKDKKLCQFADCIKFGKLKTEDGKGWCSKRHHPSFREAAAARMVWLDPLIHQCKHNPSDERKTKKREHRTCEATRVHLAALSWGECAPSLPFCETSPVCVTLDAPAKPRARQPSLRATRIHEREHFLPERISAGSKRRCQTRKSKCPAGTCRRCGSQGTVGVAYDEHYRCSECEKQLLSSAA